MAQSLPKELTQLVDKSVSLLGQVIDSELGHDSFESIEKIRRFIKAPQKQNVAGLTELKDELAQLSSEDCYHVAHSFSLMLELINACEAAYRSFRLRATRSKRVSYDGAALEGEIVHVLTAHPTESRNPAIVFYFKHIQHLLEEALEHPKDPWEDLLLSELKKVWRLPLAKVRRPSVLDEAEYIYSLLLAPDIVDLFIKEKKAGRPFYVRTWVGGDKDGHPGVDEKSMRGSLQLSRKMLLQNVKHRYQEFLQGLEPLHQALSDDRDLLRALVAQTKKLRPLVLALQTLKAGDGQRLRKFREALEEVDVSYREVFHESSPQLQDLLTLLKVFPGMVVPLELREASALVHEALEQPVKKSAIARMLTLLASLAGEEDPRFYARSFILSQTEEAADLIAGETLVDRHLKFRPLPVVPLFESAHSLQNAQEILKTYLGKSTRLKRLQKLSAHFEVMVGYSDSSKENGAFPSRYLISVALRQLEKLIESYDLKPLFFHGSGGSIERGGGSVQEQTDWWPDSALRTVKTTIQGEMIYRNYSSAAILESQLQKLQQARSHQGVRKSRDHEEPALAALSDFIQNHYRETLKDERFLEMVEQATPYAFMKDLRLGSRPAKRQGAVDIKSLRAIPWVLCWTQTRILFPTWWGFGSFWQNLSASEKRIFRRLLKTSPVFSSYVKALGFTLAKIEMPIFTLYLMNSNLPEETKDYFNDAFCKELSFCQRAFRELTGEKNLVWYRPWLETSISLRSPLIHPLNLLQLIALERGDLLLLRETVAGVASGMLTTG